MNLMDKIEIGLLVAILLGSIIWTVWGFNCLLIVTH